MMRTCRWAWLRGEIEALLTRPPVAYVRESEEVLRPIWGTRLQELVAKEAG